jgi:prepilin-type N-terminal cleavage/methylation domain-containing protein
LTSFAHSVCEEEVRLFMFQAMTPIGSKKQLTHSDQTGFGLIEVLIALVVMGILAVEMTSIFQNMNASSNNIRAKVGYQSLYSSLVQIISNQTVCYNSLTANAGNTNYSSTLAQTTGLPLQFTSQDGVTIIVGNDPTATPAPSPIPLQNYNVSIDHVLFEGGIPTGQTDPLTGAPLYSGTLKVDLEKLGSNALAAGGSGLVQMQFGPWLLAVNAGNQILNCYAQSQSPSDACTTMGGFYVASAIPPCQIAYPCQGPNIFVGYDVNSNPICQPSALLTLVTQCSAGQTVIANGSGFSCE